MENKNIGMKIVVTLLAAGILFGGYLIFHNNRSRLISDVQPLYTYCLRTYNDADCFLVNQRGRNILIDIGEEQDTDRIIRFLKRRKIQSLQYLILSQTDKEHVYGALDILDNFKVEKVIMPFHSKENWTLDQISKKCEDMGIEAITPTRTKKFDVGDIDLLIYPPDENQYKISSDNSLAILINHENVKQLFTGDAQEDRINELLKINWKNIDLIKVPYHGRYIFNVDMLIKKCSAKFAVVTSEVADQIVLDACAESETLLLYTLDGTKVFVSDGKELKLIKGKSEEY